MVTPFVTGGLQGDIEVAWALSLFCYLKKQIDKLVNDLNFNLLWTWIRLPPPPPFFKPELL